MAEKDWEDFLTPLVAEQNMAVSITTRHNFVPGGDLDALVAHYAKIDYLEFPVIDVDGVSLNLKKPNKRPEILINTRIPQVRQRFTLAHEFGHVIIPWHFGTIFSSIAHPSREADMAYREKEAEANRFAAELLMPRKWIRKLLKKVDSPAEVALEIRETAKVSNDAAIIALNNTLPSGYMYVRTDDSNRILSCARSEGTVVNYPPERSLIQKSPVFSKAKQLTHFDYRQNRHYWLYFNHKENLPVFSDNRSWKDILDQILDDLGIDEKSTRLTTKQQINGVIASNNKKGIEPEVFFATVGHRLAGRGGNAEAVANHELFKIVLAKRIAELQANSK